jgi:hypothetical protein
MVGRDGVDYQHCGSEDRVLHQMHYVGDGGALLTPLSEAVDHIVDRGDTHWLAVQIEHNGGHVSYQICDLHYRRQHLMPPILVPLSVVEAIAGGGVDGRYALNAAGEAEVGVAVGFEEVVSVGLELGHLGGHEDRGEADGARVDGLDQGVRYVWRCSCGCVGT